MAVRMAYLLRIHSYLDIAIVSMWTVSPRVDVMLGMAEASLRGESPGGEDEGHDQRDSCVELGLG